MATRKKTSRQAKKPRWLTGAIAGGGVLLLTMSMLLASREPEAVPEPAPEAAFETETIAPDIPPAPRRAAASTGKAASTRVSSGAEARTRSESASANETPTARAAAEPAAAASRESAALTTITGCLEQHDDAFRLKDTEGADAPKARSWKSGFLKRSAARVDVVDASHRLRLQNHVGHRLAVTGTLTDRELRARSVQQVASSCGR